MKWWLSLPATFREPLKSFVVSSAFGMQSVFVAIIASGFVDGQCSTPQAALQYLGSHWWAGAVGVFFGVGPYYRARQGAVAATQAQSVPPVPTPPLVTP